MDMNFYSLKNKENKTNFKNAVIQGIASDRGLYFPEKITPLSDEFWNEIGNYTDKEIAYQLIKQFVDNMDEKTLKKVISETLSFSFPVKKIEHNLYSLELFHGPTMAFKDVGARFMARCLQHFNSDNEVTVLVATSGDTGGAVANGFYKVKGVNVVILYPKGKVSSIQEKQLTTLGENITALEVDGTFDDCQEMVKTAFLDTEITNKTQLTSANSINVARWLPQMFYFAFAFKQLKKEGKELVFSVPSGNFGNICAGMLAQKLGMPVTTFIASTNENNVVTRFLQTDKYEPKPTIPTISNAMDVGNPSNFVRILELFGQDIDRLKQHLKSFWFDDKKTKETLIKLYQENNYIADPHGAIGYLGLKENSLSDNQIGVFLETAHPIKFLDIVAPLLQLKMEIPEQIKTTLNKEKKSILISDYSDLKAYLLNG
jgi:threonine synthase